MKNGFTLIELLAIIIVIAIIALITTPVVIQIISESSKNTFKSSIEELMNVTQRDYSEYARSGSVTYSLNNNSLTCPVCENEIIYTGNIEEGRGTIVNNNGQITSVNITNDQYQAKLDSKGKVVITDKN